MKNITKILILILALCQIGCFSACKKDQGNTSGDIKFDLTKDNLAEYKIVIPSENIEMNAVAIMLQGMIEKVIGTKLDIKIDKIEEGSDTYCETEYEILLGYVNRSQVREFYPSVKNNDLGYALVGKKIIIIGYDTQGANSSTMQFKMNVLDKAVEGGVLLSSGDKNVSQGEYEYSTLMLNNVEINKYKIVYSQWNDHGEFTVALNLQNWIIQKTGYVLECTNDTSEQGEYEINIGDTTRITDAMRNAREGSGYAGGKSYIGVSDKTVWLSGSNSVTLHQAVVKLLKSAVYANKTISLDINNSGCVGFDGEFSLSVMSYNVYFDIGDSKRNPDDVLKSVKQKSPDVFGLNEAGKAWIYKFNADTQISSQYGCAEGKPTDNASDASYNPIFYKKDKFELVETVTKWLSKTPDRMSKDSDAKHYKILTYAILRDKTSGTEFMYLNVHLDGSGDQAAHAAMKDLRKRQAEIVKKVAAEYPFIPVVIGGDFNEGPVSAVIAGMSKNTRFRYCMDVADTKVNINSTDVNSSFDSKSDGVIFDYLFVSADCITVQKYEQWDNKIGDKYPSDHLPVYAEITVKY